uniref:Uncharacterized protein n=1 Tax=Molossus molossus TaxID=27622 RepID=A0A7J8ER90_MOLMO|nr:hypothetical protein HJG59_008703 [Molossus molossus]
MPSSLYQTLQHSWILSADELWKVVSSRLVSLTQLPKTEENVKVLGAVTTAFMAGRSTFLTLPDENSFSLPHPKQVVCKNFHVLFNIHSLFVIASKPGYILEHCKWRNTVPGSRENNSCAKEIVDYKYGVLILLPTEKTRDQ